jgi:PKD repeat protein
MKAIRYSLSKEVSRLALILIIVITFGTSVYAEIVPNANTSSYQTGASIRSNPILSNTQLQSGESDNSTLIPDFSADPRSGSLPLTISFSDLSTGNPIAWLWSFDDGTVSTEQNPVHTFFQPRCYTISLTVFFRNSSYKTIKPCYINGCSGDPCDKEVTLSLRTGWNYISVPEKLASGYDTAGKVFENVNMNGHSIFTYDAFDRSWKSVSSETVIRCLDGIWIYSADEKAINLIVDSNSSQVNYTKSIAPGWNAIGTVGLIPISSCNLPFSCEWLYIIGFDNNSTSTSIIRGSKDPAYCNDPEFCICKYLFPTRGYWLYSSSYGEITWSN